MGLPRSAALTDFPGLGIDLDLGAGASHHPERRRIGGLPGVVIGRGVARDIAADTDDVARLHAVFFAEHLGERHVAALGQSQLRRQRRDLGTRILSGALHRMAHMIGRA